MLNYHSALETYRSGHNEPDSKSGCLHGHVGSNPTVSAICENKQRTDKESSAQECISEAGLSFVCPRNATE